MGVPAAGRFRAKSARVVRGDVVLHHRTTVIGANRNIGGVLRDVAIGVVWSENKLIAIRPLVFVDQTGRVSSFMKQRTDRLRPSKVHSYNLLAFVSANG